MNGYRRSEYILNKNIAKKKIKPYITVILGIVETICLTGIYYYWWRIGYTHGIPGYPEYYGFGKLVLTGVYALMVWIIAYFTGGFRFRRLRALNIIIKQLCVILAVNLITFLQLGLTAKQMVAKRPMFDATVSQTAFIILFVLAADAVIRRRNLAGRMLVIGDGIRQGNTVDGYRIEEEIPGPHGMTELNTLLERISGYDAVLVCGSDETTEYIIRHCLERRVAVYTARPEPLIYGVGRMKDDGMSYVLVLGIDDDEGRFFDRIRAYLT